MIQIMGEPRLILTEQKGLSIGSPIENNSRPCPFSTFAQRKGSPRISSQIITFDGELFHLRSRPSVVGKGTRRNVDPGVEFWTSGMVPSVASCMSRLICWKRLTSIRVTKRSIGCKFLHLQCFRPLEDGDTP
jgi:hypothetical protein